MNWATEFKSFILENSNWYLYNKKDTSRLKKGDTAPLVRRSNSCYQNNLSNPVPNLLMILLLLIFYYCEVAVYNIFVSPVLFKKIQGVTEIHGSSKEIWRWKIPVYH